MKCDLQQIKEHTSFEFETEEELLEEIKSTLNYLESHNRTYNKTQYFLISELKDLFKYVN